MEKLTDFLRKNRFILLVILLSIPTFWRMLMPGIHSMQDFHLFRLYEFDKCARALQIPCRWSPDAGLGYGEPIFNFYGQLPYMIGELFHLIGFSLVDSLKLLFIFSLLGSGIFMFYLARHLWKSDWAGLISSAIYLYAPYRAVDVWVRGALPEALSFVLFPLIILAIEKRSFRAFSFFFAALILTHNLSAVMFLPVILVWVLSRRFLKAVPAGILSLSLSAFYVLPVIFESKFINLQSTTQGYFDFRGHFVTLHQLLVSRFWGYGGSTFGSEDGLSLSVGFVQWTLPVVILALILLKRKLKDYKEFLILFLAGWFFLFLTHNRSTFFWKTLPFMAYIQFPWRFLGVATFCFALISGAILSLLKTRKTFAALAIIVILIFLNLSFFREDIWYKVDDTYFTKGEEWDRQRASSIGDFWPDFGHKIPDKPASGEFINYFPGWVGANPNESGLIPSKEVTFKDTPVRRIGNIVSLVSLTFLLWKRKRL